MLTKNISLFSLEEAIVVMRQNTIQRSGSGSMIFEVVGVAPSPNHFEEVSLDLDESLRIHCT